MANLPSYFSLKSKYNNKYLCYTKGNKNSKGLLKYSDKILVGPFTKFSIQPSEIEEGLVHIKSCYNNKFWARMSENSTYIGAIANEEESDNTKWSCTLFKPIFVSQQNAYYFLHVQLNLILRIVEANPEPYTGCLSASVKDLTNNLDEDNLVLSSVVDWDSLFILPTYSAFKSNNVKFLKPLDEFLQFSAPNVDNIEVTFKIEYVEDAYILVKHFDSNKSWIRRSNNYIHCEDIENHDDPNSLFLPLKIDNNLLGLRNKGNDQFCKRYTAGKYINYLSALTLNVNDKTVGIEVKDAAIAKKIEDLEYALDDARVYGNKIVSLCEGIAINNTQVESEVTVAFKWQKEMELLWSSTVSKILGVTTTFSAKIPIIDKLGFWFEDRDGNKWDRIESEKSVEDVKETIVVPPMSKVEYVATVTQASYDIPFSYNRLDTLQDDIKVTKFYEDGLFSGSMAFDYQFKTKTLPV